MAKQQSWNPLAFRKTPVSIIGPTILLASLVALLVVHLTVPPIPTSPTPADGVNLTQAWLDLKELSNGHHPWVSKRNDEVQVWLKSRIQEILEDNGADYATVHATHAGFISDHNSPKDVTFFANDSSSTTCLDDYTWLPQTLYTESQNIIVYIRGSNDDESNWWNTSSTYSGPSGVLVNAHYDSVSSGYGATDDGMGVVTILQLLSYFTRPSNRPYRGIVLLLNNGEEDGLFGARAFARHPVARFPHTFLNLEGAGAGGRAMLFRSTDAEVTRAYADGTPHPFGNVVTLDGFKRGVVRSGTDFTIFTQQLGMRGLDLAFFEPRARYHTGQDDARDTSRESLWHMLQSALGTVAELTAHSGSDFDGGEKASRGNDGVYFDLFGQVMAVVKLHDIFALSVTLLVVGPVLLIALEIILRKSDKWYPLANKKFLYSEDDDEIVRLHGRRGFFRLPVAFVLSGAIVALLGYLLAKVNPYIIYSSQYTVWAMFLSINIASAWFILAGAANIRSTALHRMFALLWIYAASWVALVLATVGENVFTIGSGYFVLMYNASVFVAILISYLELFFLPTTKKYVETVLGTVPDTASIRAPSRDQSIRNVPTGDSEEPDERTSLLSRRRRGNSITHSGSIRRSRFEPADVTTAELENTDLNEAFPDEQPWSSKLPQWTWILQYLVLVPINFIIVGQIALITTSSLHQTPADGSPVLGIYLVLATLTTVLILPTTPFLHRVTHHIPTFLFFIFAGCLAYSLVAYPFTRDARLHVFFNQQIDLVTGHNNVSLRGVPDYVQDVVAELPSSAGKIIECQSIRNGEGVQCSWPGLAPRVVPDDYRTSTHLTNSIKKKALTDSWVTYNITSEARTATLSIQGLNTRYCRLIFASPVSSVRIEGATPPDPRLPPAVPLGGSKAVHLVSREWDKTFKVNVTWPTDDESGAVVRAKGQRGRVSCLWDDANETGNIPAWDEFVRFAPVWVAPTKAQTGLVEGWKDFVV